MSVEEWKLVVDEVTTSRKPDMQPPTPGQLLAILDELRQGARRDGPTREELDAADAEGDRIGCRE
jgi:hypothetical protein